MADPARPVQSVRGASEGFAHSALFEWMSRAGFVARGLIYGLIGLLALELALDVGGRITNQQGALRTIAQQPTGTFLLILVTAGLGSYATWRLFRAALGHGPEGRDSTFDRIAAAASGLVYAGLCAIGIQILLDSRHGGRADPDQTTAGVLGWPAGAWLVGLAGCVLIGVGAYQGYRGLTRSFLEDSKTEQMSRELRVWFTRIGVFGHLARMVVFALVGVFLVKAAIEYDAREAVGLDGALAKLAQASYGPVLLGVVASGLIAFALYSISDARYRRI
jgi:hypothetical protein